MQMHMSQNGNEVGPEIDEIIEIMQSFGVPVYITEMDINQQHLSGNKNLTQAEIAKIVITACIRSGVCVDIGFFGTEDYYSWLGPETRAHLFDYEGKPKPFYYAVQQGLFEEYQQGSSLCFRF